MNCKKIQQLILTDYYDNEVTDYMHTIIEQHILNCPDCRAFADEVKEHAVLTAKKYPEIMPPPAVWFQVKKSIEAIQGRRAIPAFLYDLIDWLTARIHPFYISAAVSLTILIIVIITQIPVNHTQYHLVGEYLHEQLSFLGKLNGEEKAEHETDFNGNFDTTIEEYFL